ncbi:hypothetical protein COXBURSA331_0018 (plasmid) [Coxiella burnetii RSA 331]|nr:hypothetical protein COXBURSA331_0018 [Coxiella burnetii RSA 331]EAX32557.1 hypothetical protein A35_0036 [Coxiella burnetii 'MSU Goat Q177']
MGIWPEKIKCAANIIFPRLIKVNGNKFGLTEKKEILL